MRVGWGLESRGELGVKSTVWETGQRDGTRLNRRGPQGAKVLRYPHPTTSLSPRPLL